jgi:cytoskeletal protein RodZ
MAVPRPARTNSVRNEATATRMPTVADQLRQARDAQNLSIQQAAESTKIRSDHLRALEEGNYKVFPAPIYIRGSVRSYANLLRLDLAKIMADLEAELSRSPHNAPPNLSPPRKSFVDLLMLWLSRVNWQIALPVLGLLLAGTIMLGLYRAYESYRTHDPLKNLGPGLYQSSRTNAGEILPLPQNPAE